tara:strand:- start:278 stop:499 length:222 start_codon:yes stop_codon:yes gene_type:complete
VKQLWVGHPEATERVDLREMDHHLVHPDLDHPVFQETTETTETTGMIEMTGMTGMIEMTGMIGMIGMMWMHNH